ncbi:MAG: KH domain-containing protein [Deltaproteobacteria bacterium]|jgi:predicted RNA-binding protein YlqC (UPF0109 family)|nr:KH domain-containing protein [Deltaproteobacteria bacterium]
MRDLVYYLATSLSSYPERVEVAEHEAEPGQKVLKLKVHPMDLCGLIGKNGRAIRAIRVLMAVAATKKGQNYLLKVDTDLDIA